MPICFACTAASQNAEMTMSWSPSHLLVWPNSTSNAFPVGAITLPSGHLLREGSCDIGDHRDPVALPLNVGAPAALPDTNLVATLNKRLVDRYSDDPALAIVAAPVELEPFHYFMVWHPRLDHDPAQRWLRDTIRAVTATTVGTSVTRR